MGKLYDRMTRMFLLSCLNGCEMILNDRGNGLLVREKYQWRNFSIIVKVFKSTLSVIDIMLLMG
jgi:hypothetical protein